MHSSPTPTASACNSATFVQAQNGSKQAHSGVFIVMAYWIAETDYKLPDNKIFSREPALSEPENWRDGSRGSPAQAHPEQSSAPLQRWSFPLIRVAASRAPTLAVSAPSPQNALRRKHTPSQDYCAPLEGPRRKMTTYKSQKSVSCKDAAAHCKVSGTWGGLRGAALVSGGVGRAVCAVGASARPPLGRPLGKHARRHLLIPHQMRHLRAPTRLPESMPNSFSRSRLSFCYYSCEHRVPNKNSQNLRQY